MEELQALAESLVFSSKKCGGHVANRAIPMAYAAAYASSRRAEVAAAARRPGGGGSGGDGEEIESIPLAIAQV